jgi:ferredoxin
MLTQGATIVPFRSRPMRPPGAIDHDAFLERCTGCGDCAEVCPQTAIRCDEAGYAFLARPDRCSQCGLCADVCMHGAIEWTPATRTGLDALITREREITRRTRRGGDRPKQAG